MDNRKNIYLILVRFSELQLHEVWAWVKPPTSTLGKILPFLARLPQELGSPIVRSDSSDVIPFVFTNNSANPQVFGMIKESLNLLAPSPRMETVMNGKRFIAAKRQTAN